MQITKMRMTRKEKALRQKDVAAMVGISRPAYRAIETNKSSPRLETAKKISTALGLHVAELQDLVDYEPKVTASLRIRAKEKGARGYSEQRLFVGEMSEEQFCKLFRLIHRFFNDNEKREE